MARTFEKEAFSDYHCLNCDGRVEALRGQSIEKFPEVLIIVIQRYIFEEGERKRLAAEIEFPLEGLDLTPYVTDREGGISGRRTVYKCTGVLEHHGASANSGHYTATLLTGEGGGWMVFNDEKVGTHEWTVKEGPRKKRRLSKGRAKRKSMRKQEDDDDDCTMVTESSSGSGKRSPTLEDTIDEASPDAPTGSSKTAYMLIYTREDAVVNAEGAAVEKEEETLLPRWLKEEVGEINSKVIETGGPLLDLL